MTEFYDPVQQNDKTTRKSRQPLAHTQTLLTLG